MQYVNDNDLGADVDIYNLVLNMRHNRPHMVQSEVSNLLHAEHTAAEQTKSERKHRI